MGENGGRHWTELAIASETEKGETAKDAGQTEVTEHEQ